MTDPYSVLGVARDAEMDEIKKAYRRLSRTYHPDANINNPNKDQAEEKFKQVQDAYNQIVKERERGTAYDQGFSGAGYSYGGFGRGFGYEQGYRRDNTADYDEGDVQMRAAANFINNGLFQEALNLLENIPGRNARWYYLNACAQQGLGNTIASLQSARVAVQMEPGNGQYRMFLDHLENGGSQWYETTARSYGFNGMNSNMGSCCAECLMINLMCNCCCGGCC